eukprot:c10493_g1_i1 orf=24-215(+)
MVIDNNDKKGLLVVIVHEQSLEFKVCMETKPQKSCRLLGNETCVFNLLPILSTSSVENAKNGR